MTPRKAWLADQAIGREVTGSPHSITNISFEMIDRIHIFPGIMYSLKCSQSCYGKLGSEGPYKGKYILPFQIQEIKFFLIIHLNTHTRLTDHYKILLIQLPLKIIISDFTYTEGHAEM